MNKKAIFLPPLLGSFISLLCMVIYLFITNLSILKKSSPEFWLDFVFSILKILPVTFLLICTIAYLFYFTVGYCILKIKNKYYFSARLFWFISLLAGFITGFIFVISANYFGQETVKSILIIISFSLGSLFTASLFSVLNNEIK